MMIFKESNFCKYVSILYTILIITIYMTGGIGSLRKCFAI